MKKVVLVAAVAAFSLAGASCAFAVDATQNIGLNANVASTCVLTGGAGVTATIPVTAGAVDITPITVAGLGTVSCNRQVRLTLTSLNQGVVLAGGAVGGGFTNRIDYQASADFNGAITQSLDTSVAATSGASAYSTGGSGTFTNGTLTVSITPIAPVDTLDIGAYSDTLALIVSPAP